MSKRTAWVVATAVAVLAGGFAGVTDSSAFMGHRGHGPTPIDWEVVGTIVVVQLPASVPGLLIDAYVKGAPGRAQFRVLGVGDEMPAYIPECGEDAGMPNGQYLKTADMVITFEDQSMLFAQNDGLQSSWSCFTGQPAVTNMKVVGGTGKYESAEGAWQGVFFTPFLGASGALLAETGTIKGWVKP